MKTRPTLAPSEPHPFGVDATRRAITRYQETAHRANAIEAMSSAKNDDETDKWNQVAFNDGLDSERHLLRAILAWGWGASTRSLHDAYKRLWPACGVSFAGRLYLALPYPTGDIVAEGEILSDGGDAMYLAVVDLVNVVTL
jgi:hypothetical protein